MVCRAPSDVQNVDWPDLLAARTAIGRKPVRHGISAKNNSASYAIRAHSNLGDLKLCKTPFSLSLSLSLARSLADSFLVSL